MKSLFKIIIACFIPLLGIGAALTALEVIIRLFGPTAGPSKIAWSDRPQFYFKSQNATTMQDYHYQAPKPATTFRIAAIGDSFTFAPYMQFTDTYVKKLEAMLNIADGSRTAEVINYGVPAYSTSHEVSVASKAIYEGADLLLLQITLNDPEAKKHTPMGIRENMEDRFGPLVLSGRVGALASHWRTLKFVLTRLHNSRTHRAYIEYFNDLFNNPKTWGPFVESMKRLVDSAKNNNKPIVAVVFPLFGIAMDKNYPFYPIHAKVAELMRQLNVPSIDLSDIFKDIPLERLQVIPGVDRHPNEIAHRMAAETIYLWLEKQQLIPEKHLIKEKFATRLGIDEQRPWIENDIGLKSQ